jgi:hypothetical protein
MVTQERHHTPNMLQPGLIDVEIHPIEALDLQGHMPGEDISGTASYGHKGLRSTQALCGQPTASGGSKRDRKAPHLGSTGAHKPTPQAATTDPNPGDLP